METAEEVDEKEGEEAEAEQTEEAEEEEERREGRVGGRRASGNAETKRQPGDTGVSGNKTDEFHPRPHPKSVRLAPIGCPSGEIGRRAWDDLRVAP